MAALPTTKNLLKRGALSLCGLATGALLLWIALRGIDPSEIEAAIGQVNPLWLAGASTAYLASIACRCVRWGTLLRATGSVKWRHVAETLIVGFAANYLLPGRIGELFRAEYARRLFDMSRFTSLGTIVVERVCDGVILVCALWIGLGFMLPEASAASPMTSWMVGVGAASSLAFGGALLFVIVSRRLDLRRFGVPEPISIRWSRLVEGTSSVARGNVRAIVLWSLVIWALEILALGSTARAFAVSLSMPQLMALIALASLSTLLPTAPAYLGTYQLVFAHMFAQFGATQGVGIVVATAMQLFCFGAVAILGALVLLSRGGITMLRAFRR
jgi:uncharacterized membrane protein YbhN (UPF0104 family)